MLQKVLQKPQYGERQSKIPSFWFLVFFFLLHITFPWHSLICTWLAFLNFLNCKIRISKLLIHSPGILVFNVVFEFNHETYFTCSEKMQHILIVSFYLGPYPYVPYTLFSDLLVGCLCFLLLPLFTVLTKSWLPKNEPFRKQMRICLSFTKLPKPLWKLVLLRAVFISLRTLPNLLSLALFPKWKAVKERSEEQLKCWWQQDGMRFFIHR